MICPCKDCEKKGCGKYHDLCLPYNKYKRWKSAVNQAERQERKGFYYKKRLFKKGDYKNYGKINDVEKND